MLFYQIILFPYIIPIKTLLKHIITLLYHLLFYNFWTIISYYIIFSKAAIISLFSILSYQLYILVSINTIISIKTLL
jgi:hypothetical protein